MNRRLRPIGLLADPDELDRYSVRIAEGKSVTIGVYDTAESAAAAQPKVGELLGRLADVVNAPPAVQEGPVFWEL